MPRKNAKFTPDCHILCEPCGIEFFTKRGYAQHMARHSQHVKFNYKKFHRLLHKKVLGSRRSLAKRRVEAGGE